MDTIDPTALTLSIAERSALDKAVIPPPPPVLNGNATFAVQFFGPTLQCNDSSEFVQKSFDRYKLGYSQESKVFTEDLITPEKRANNFLVYSAFSPTIEGVNPRFQKDSRDPYGNWNAEILKLDQGSGRDVDGTLVGRRPQEVWVQLANTNMVCSLVNASFHVVFNYTNGMGRVIEQNVAILPGAPEMNTTAVNVRFEDLRGDLKLLKSPYFSTFKLFGNELFGNASLSRTLRDTYLAEASTKLLRTGLASCDEIAHNHWYQTLGLDANGTKFPGEPWWCRNRTLARGIEDLANNITISMLSSANLTVNATGTVLLWELKNQYSEKRSPLQVTSTFWPTTNLSNRI